MTNLDTDILRDVLILCSSILLFPHLHGTTNEACQEVSFHVLSLWQQGIDRRPLCKGVLHTLATLACGTQALVQFRTQFLFLQPHSDEH